MSFGECVAKAKFYKIALLWTDLAHSQSQAGPVSNRVSEHRSVHREHLLYQAAMDNHDKEMA